MAVKSSSLIPGLTGRRGGGGSLPHHLLSYGRFTGSKAKAKANRTRSGEDDAPVRHRLVICNAYRELADLAAIHKRPGDSRSQ